MFEKRKPCMGRRINIEELYFAFPSYDGSIMLEHFLRKINLAVRRDIFDL
jgi:hypothetical protein